MKEALLKDGDKLRQIMVGYDLLSEKDQVNIYKKVKQLDQDFSAKRKAASI